MKQTVVALWTLVGVALSSAVAFAVPVSNNPGNGTGASVSDRSVLTSDVQRVGADASQFSGGKTLVLDARVGHKALPPSGGETFLFASVAGAEGSTSTASPIHVGLVIDRSGSMKGQRIANALAAATGTVERMRDGDLVTVVSFDDRSQVVVSPTRLSRDTRPQVEAAINGIRLGGDTCISCGLETAMQELMSADRGSANPAITRMMLLSDGAANQGVRDVAGLRQIAARMRDRGCTISTIGVDVDFDEKIMSAIATESNGKHHFVANPADLPNVFRDEFDSLLSTVARDAELEIELAPGVEPVEVFDRAHRRSGQRITVPFGTFSSRQEKTVLMKVRVSDTFGRGSDASMPIAKLHLAYQDAVKFGREQTDGELAVLASPRASLDDIDPFVLARLSRSRTAQTLTEANQLFEQGRVAEARARLSRQAADLEKSETQAKAAAPAAAKPKASSRGLGDDFDDQLAAVRNAESSFGSAAPADAPAASEPAKRAGKAQVRTSAERAQALGF